MEDICFIRYGTLISNSLSTPSVDNSNIVKLIGMGKEGLQPDSLSKEKITEFLG